jgi:acetylornithine/succinyldiaminopimelate/putrescine aminotransferase
MSAAAEVRGMGMMLGVGLKEGYQAGELVKALLDKGLLALTAGHNTIRLLPPLTISQAELDQGIAILAQVLDA